VKTTHWGQVKQLSLQSLSLLEVQLAVPQSFQLLLGQSFGFGLLAGLHDVRRHGFVSGCWLVARRVHLGGERRGVFVMAIK